MKYNPNNKLINFSDTHLRMVEELKERTGLKSLTAIIQNSLILYHKSYFPAYANKENSSNVPLTDTDIIRNAEQKAKVKLAQKEAEELAKLKPKIDMCKNLLGGEIETNEKGFKYCRFTQYGTEESKDSSMLIPIKQVDPIIAETSLFMPSKEVVFAKRVDIKRLFSS